ncbi:MAG: ABC transporter ATP-binding protein, partial [Burkholderiaceae bacterium]
ITQSERAAQWAETRQSAVTPGSMAAEKSSPSTAATTAVSAEKTTATHAKRKLSYKEQRELEALPNTITALEQEHTTITAQLDNGALFGTDVALATQLTQRLTAIDDALLEALERMEALGG